MPRCTFKNTTGKVCNLKSDHLQFVLLNDPHDRIVMKKYGCIQHMNIIIDYLMVNQLGREYGIGQVAREWAGSWRQDFECT